MNPITAPPRSSAAAPETTVESTLRVTDLLPQQEWCEDCALDVDTEPGMARDVLHRTSTVVDPPPAEWDPAWGPGPEYDITHLSCGHDIVTLIR